MTTEYRTKETVIDLYRILGLKPEVSKEINCDELIHNAYIAKVKKCHPDRFPGDKKKEEIYTLITGAYNILKTPSGRNAYNKKKKLADSSTSDHEALKHQSQQFMKMMAQTASGTIGDTSTEGAIMDDKGYMKPSDEMQEIFKRRMKEMDERRKGQDYGPVSAKLLAERYSQVEKERKEIDAIRPPNPFADRKFDPKLFNAFFDAHHRGDDTQITLREGIPDGWIPDDDSFGAFGEEPKDDDFFDEDPKLGGTRNQRFAPVDSIRPVEYREIDVDQLTGADYYDQHSQIGPAYYDDIKARLRERQKDTERFDARRRSDYTNDTYGYGVTDDPVFADLLEIEDDDEDITARFKALQMESSRER
jgi:curved DNA-binding protein CbpA